LKIKLKSNIGKVEIHTQGYDGVFAPGQIYEVNEEIYQRQILGTRFFEPVSEAHNPKSKAPQKEDGKPLTPGI